MEGMRMETPSGKLTDRTAIVTGASQGIGRAIALAYAREGASVCCAARNLKGLQAVVAEIESAGGRAIAVQTDVTDLAQVEAMTQACIDAFGKIDILVVNAGVNLDRYAVEESDPDNWMATVDVNLKGAYFCAKAAVPVMKKQSSGHIIMIGSGLGHRAVPNRSAYACSKAGLWMLTRVLAEELWEHNICVNELIPGVVVTDMTGYLKGDPDDPQSTPNVPLDREWLKQPEDVVPLAMFLATQPERGATGQSFSLMRRDSQ